MPGYDKGVTVPAMVEIASGKVATNAYAELEFDLATQWSALHREGAPDLFPPSTVTRSPRSGRGSSTT